MHCAKWLRDVQPHLLAFHVANERDATFAEHRKLQRLGVLAGVADWLVFPRTGRPVAIELKNFGGKQTEEQRIFQQRWELAGNSYYIVRTLDFFKTIIVSLTLF